MSTSPTTGACCDIAELTNALQVLLTFAVVTHREAEYRVQDTFLRLADDVIAWARQLYWQEMPAHIQQAVLALDGYIDQLNALEAVRPREEEP